MIIENKNQLSEFLKGYSSQNSIIIPIQNDENKHPIQDGLCLLYVQLWDETEYILPFNHSETLNIDIPDLNSQTTKFTPNKKQLSHLISINNVVDTNLLTYGEENKPISLEDISTNDLKHFIKKRTNEKLVELGYVDLGNYFAYDHKASSNLDWFYHLTGGVTHTDFFAIRPTDYSKANEGEDFEDIW